MLSTFTYTSAITGKLLDETLKAALGSINVNSPSIGKLKWQAVLGVLYSDFNVTMSSQLLSFLQQAQVQYAPGEMAALIYSGNPSLTAFLSKVNSSSESIDTNTKQACSGQTVNTDLGKKYWNEAFKQIFKDIVDVLYNAVSNAFTSTTHIIPIGSIAPPNSGTTVPVPGMLLTPFDSNSLKNYLEAQLSDSNAQTSANNVHSQIISTFQTYTTSSLQKQLGTTYWQIFLTELQTKISMYIETAIINWVMSSPEHFAIPSGTPGTNPAGIPPIIPSIGPMLGFII